jgi:hypothetical protein
MHARRLAFAALASAVLAASAPATAGDVCVQYSGAECDLSGDLGFFRFMGAKLPKSPKKAVDLHGRACGTGTVTGTAVQNPAGNLVVLGATFICDGTPGVITSEMAVADTSVGSTHAGDASYGAFDLASSCTVTVVDCDTEPGLP